MRTTFNKIIKSIIVAILVLEIAFPVLKSESGISNAAEMNSGQLGYFDGMEDLVAEKTTSDWKKFKDQVKVYAYNGAKGSFINLRYQMRGGYPEYWLDLRSGTKFKTMRKDKDDNYESRLYVKKSNNEEIWVDKWANITDIYITSEMLENYKNQYGSNITLLLKIVQSKRGFLSDAGEVFGELYINVLPNKIALGLDKVASYKKAIIQDGVLYIQPGAMVGITNEAFPQATVWAGIDRGLSITGSGFSVSSNAMSLTATGSAGQTGTLTYNCAGETLSIPVRISNLKSKYFTVNGSTSANGETYNGNKVYKSVGVDIKNSKPIQVVPCKPGSAFDNCEISLENFYARQDGRELKVERKDNYYLVYPNKEGYVEITNYNYENEAYTEYVKVYQTATPTVINTKVENVVKEDTTTKQNTTKEPTTEPQKNEYYEQNTQQDDHSYDVPYPVVKLDKEVENPDTGKITYYFKTENCAFASSKVIRRTDDNKMNLPEFYGYWSSKDNYKSKIYGNYSVNNSFIVTIDPQYGEGIFDIIVPVYNHKQFSDGSIWYHDVRYEFYDNVVCAKPEVSYKVIEQSNDTLVIEGKASAKYKTPVTSTRCEIYWSETESGKKTLISSSDSLNCNIKIDNNQFKPGHYTINLIATNKYNKTETKTIKAQLFNDAKFKDNKFQIIGEDEGVISTGTARDKQSIQFQIEDKDLNDKVTVKYVVSKEDKDIEELRDKPWINGGLTGFFANPKCTLTKDAKDGDIITIDIPAGETDDNTMKYVYIALQDNHSTSTYNTVMKTGAICFSGGPLQLEAIEKATEDDKTSYGLNTEFKVKLLFNLELNTALDKIPDLYLNFGGVEKKQIKVETNEKNAKEVTYVYKIEEDCNNGNIELSRFDGQFESKNSAEKTYSKQIGTDTYEGLRDEITGNYTVDLVKPTVNNIKINLQAKDSDITTIEGKKYISSIEDANIVLNYSEEVEGRTGAVVLNKGNRNELNVMLTSTNVRSEESQSIKDDVENIANDVEGYLKYKSIVYVPDEEITAKDKAGNTIENIENVNVEYFLNGTKVENTETIVLDSSVYEPRLFINENELKGNGTYKTGTTITGFAEFKEALNYLDQSGLKTIKMEVYYTDNVVVLDKDNQPITNGTVTNSDKVAFVGKTTYLLDAAQLPLKLKMDNEGLYNVKMTKEDNVGNTSEKEYLFGIRDEISIDKDNSYVYKLDENGNKVIIEDMYNTKKHDINNQIMYNLRLQLTNLNPDDVKVHLQVNRNGEISYTDLGNPVKVIHNGDIAYADYTFTNHSSGELVICVTKLDQNSEFNIDDINDADKTFKDTITIDNLFLPGDLDCDGLAYRLNDLIVMLKYLANQIPKTNAIKYASNVYGGMDANGNLIDASGNVTDAVLIARIVANDVELTLDEWGYIE